MPFSSIHFIFLFLPLTLAAYFLVPKAKRNLVLALSSIFFFAWGDPSHLPLLVATIFLHYFVGIYIGHLVEAEKDTTSRRLRVLAVGLDLLILIFYKYLGFFADQFETITRIPLNIGSRALPIGISYFTFTGISYLVDVYHEVVPPERNLVRFSSYLVMFPKLVQGPITRYQDVQNDLAAADQPSDNLTSDDLTWGIRRFIIGLAKKVLLADSLVIVSNKVFGTNPTLLGAGLAWFGLLTFALVIFFDFSGYTDMALGVARMLGFKLPENFNNPYQSISVTDFWRRWHITLTSWFRTYVFMPLEFARRKQKHLRLQSNILIVFILSGLWHGASWNFVIWGAYYGAVLALEASGLGKILKKLPLVLQRLYTLLLILVGWVFFRLTDLTAWLPFFRALSGAQGWAGPVTLRSLEILYYVPILVIAIIACLPLVVKAEKSLLAKPITKSFLPDLATLGIFLLSIASLLFSGFEFFMYSQF